MQDRTRDLWRQRRGPGQADMQFTLLAALRTLHLVHRGFHLLHDCARAFLQPLPSRRQLHAAMASHEQARADQFLQLPDLLAERRL